VGVSGLPLAPILGFFPPSRAEKLRRNRRVLGGHPSAMPPADPYASPRDGRRKLPNTQIRSAALAVSNPALQTKKQTKKQLKQQKRISHDRQGGGGISEISLERNRSSRLEKGNLPQMGRDSRIHPGAVFKAPN